MRASGEAILREFMTNERYPVQPGATGFTGCPAMEASMSIAPPRTYWHIKVVGRRRSSMPAADNEKTGVDDLHQARHRRPG